MTPTPDDFIQPSDELNNDDLTDELEFDESGELLDELGEQPEESETLLADEPNPAELEEIEAEDEEEDTEISLVADRSDDTVRMYLKEIG